MAYDNQKDKLDITGLGLRVRDNLIKLGIETPMVSNNLSSEQKVQELTSLYQKSLAVHGIDLNDDSMADTPKRIAKLQVYEAFSGMDYANFPKITVVQNKFYDGAVHIRDIRFVSMCEHHHERVIGKVWVSYLPNRDVPGLSKVARLVDFFASRPIVQERATSQIFESMKLILGTEDVAVTIKSVHLCMYARGIKDPCSTTVTALKGGSFFSDARLRSEYESQVDYNASVL